MPKVLLELAVVQDKTVMVQSAPPQSMIVFQAPVVAVDSTV
jgi:hypothetical protein